jgi:hypothetical protein
MCGRTPVEDWLEAGRKAAEVHLESEIINNQMVLAALRAPLILIKLIQSATLTAVSA